MKLIDKQRLVVKTALKQIPINGLLRLIAWIDGGKELLLNGAVTSKGVH
jgi:hypothetical protein